MDKYNYELYFDGSRWVVNGTKYNQRGAEGEKTHKPSAKNYPHSGAKWVSIATDGTETDLGDLVVDCVDYTFKSFSPTTAPSKSPTPSPTSSPTDQPNPSPTTSPTTCPTDQPI